MQILTTHFQSTLLAGLGKFLRDPGWKARAARGSVWLGGGSAAENGFRFLRNMVLTRLLAPEAFGLMFIVNAFTGAVDAFTQIGIREAIVQHPEGNRKTYLNGAWWLSFLRGLLLYGIAMALSPLVAGFYEKPEIIPLLSVGLLGIVFSSSLSPNAYVSIKQMRYSRWVLLHHGGAIVGIGTTLVLGFLFRNVWALAIGFAAEAAARCILSFILCPFLPTFTFSGEHGRALLKYVKGVFGLGVLAYLYGQADVFVVGKICTMEDLAIYGLAYNLVYFPNFFCDAVISPILLPALAAVQSDKERLTQRILRISSALSAGFFPLFALMACSAFWLLRIVYGPVYSQAGYPFIILCASSAIRIVGGTLVTLYFATGRPELNRQASFLRMVVMVGLIIPLVMRFGLVGAALSGLLASGAWQVYNVLRLRGLLGLNAGQYMKSLSVGIGLATLILALWFGLQWIL